MYTCNHNPHLWSSNIKWKKWPCCLLNRRQRRPGQDHQSSCGSCKSLGWSPQTFGQGSWKCLIKTKILLRIFTLLGCPTCGPLGLQCWVGRSGPNCRWWKTWWRDPLGSLVCPTALQSYTTWGHEDMIHICIYRRQRLNQPDSVVGVCCQDVPPVRPVSQALHPHPLPAGRLWIRSEKKVKLSDVYLSRTVPWVSHWYSWPLLPPCLDDGRRKWNTDQHSYTTLQNYLHSTKRELWSISFLTTASLRPSGAHEAQVRESSPLWDTFTETRLVQWNSKYNMWLEIMGC